MLGEITIQRKKYKNNSIFIYVYTILYYFFSNRVVNRWNKLDQQIVRATSFNAFKNGLDKLKKVQDGLLHGLIC